MVFDGHCDIFTGVLQRRLKGDTQVLENFFLPQLKAGGIEGGCFVLWVDPPYDKDPAARVTQIAQAISAEMATTTEAVIVHNRAEIEAAKAAEQFYILLGAEGLAAIGDDLENLDRLYDFGVRHAMLTWNEENQLATGARGTPERGLTALGRDALRRMEEKHMIIDVSHLNDRSFWDVMDIATTPILASHSNARALVDVPRNLSDDQLRAIAETGGVIGLNAFNEFVSSDPVEQNVDHFIQHAVYIADKIGVEHLAFGFDFSDYVSQEALRTFTSQPTPNTEGLEDCSKVPAFLEKMQQAGFTDDDMEKISCGNWLRLIDTVLG